MWNNIILYSKAMIVHNNDKFWCFYLLFNYDIQFIVAFAVISVLLWMVKNQCVCVDGGITLLDSSSPKKNLWWSSTESKNNTNRFIIDGIVRCSNAYRFHQYWPSKQFSYNKPQNLTFSAIACTLYLVQAFY